MINIITVENSIEIAKQNGFIKKLNHEYKKIDDGKCSGCTNCCSESVHTYYIEFLNIYYHFINNKEKYNRLTEKIKKYYIEEYYRINKCPMLSEEGKCEIYEVRPLVCRLFGHYSKQEHEANYRKINETNKSIQEFIKNEYKFVIPDEIVNRKIDYCNAFYTTNRIERSDRLSIQDHLLNIDSKYFAMEMINEDFIHFGLVDWFITLTCGEDIYEEKIKSALNHA